MVRGVFQVLQVGEKYLRLILVSGQHYTLALLYARLFLSGREIESHPDRFFDEALQFRDTLRGSLLYSDFR